MVHNKDAQEQRHKCTVFGTLTATYTYNYLKKYTVAFK